MKLEPTDEQRAVRATVRRFLAEKAPMTGHVRQMLNDPKGTTDLVWRGLADLGATALLVPVEYGGEGMSMLEAGIVCEELGAALHPGPWLSSAVAATRALVRFDAIGAAAAQVAGLADGSRIATVAPLGRDDIFPRYEQRGDEIVLHGRLDPVPDAAAADTLLVLAQDDRGSELFSVSMSSPGIEITPITGVDLSRKLFGVTLADVPAQLLARLEGQAGRDAAEALIDDVLIGYAADALGSATQLLAMTLDYAKVRRQFGQPIGSFQAVAHLCADMYETVELARSGVLYALWAADMASGAERHLAAQRVKALAGKLAGVGDLAIQVFGGIGFTWDHDAHLYLKRLLSFSRFLGRPDDYLESIGADLIARTRTDRETEALNDRPDANTSRQLAEESRT